MLRLLVCDTLREHSASLRDATANASFAMTTHYLSRFAFIGMLPIHILVFSKSAMDFQGKTTGETATNNVEFAQATTRKPLELLRDTEALLRHVWFVNLGVVGMFMLG